MCVWRKIAIGLLKGSIPCDPAVVPLLVKFLATHRVRIIARTREKVALRAAPRATELELTHGVPMFLDQLAESLQASANSLDRIGESGTLHGAELFKRGLTIGQVVHDYGNIYQAVAEIGVELGESLSTEDLRRLNLCLDVAIAEAVTEYARQREAAIVGRGLESLGSLAHELRNQLNSATLAYQAISSGNVGVSGSTGAVLGRSLAGMRDLISRSLAEVRLEAGTARTERVCVATLLEEIEISAAGDAKSAGQQLSIELVDPRLTVDADYQILVSILTNLVQNACKFTRAGGHIVVDTRVTTNRVSIDVADECGGLPPGKPEELFRPFEQRDSNRSGLGLGLAICLKGAHALGGDLKVRNVPGKHCVFTLELPRAG